MFNSNDTIGPYRLERELGQGAFGVVWLAEWQSPVGTQQVAIKFPTRIDYKALLKEVVVWLKAGTHENVLPFVDADIYGNQVIIVSEYAPDGSLEDWLLRNGRRAPDALTAAQMTLGILSGLEHLHSKKIVHRDIKPANVLLSGETPRLADFGMSRVLDVAQSAVVGGSPAYMSPEAWDNERTEQSDLWSVGVMLYEMVAGKLPFMGGSFQQVMMAICMREPDLSLVPRPLQDFLAHTLEKKPRNRFATASEMRAALHQLVQAETAPLPTTGRFFLRETPALDRAGNLVRLRKGHTRYEREDLGGGVHLDLVVVPGGTFLMGSPYHEKGHEEDEDPPQTVTLKPFSMGIYPVTRAQWQAVAALPQVARALPADPAHFKEAWDAPVESVKWLEAEEFCRRLSQHTGANYRLPTEAEWEYACRAGTTTPFAFGETLTTAIANYDGSNAYQQEQPGPHREQTTKVGTFPANAFGLYDMHGNVWEWCADWHSHYQTQIVNDPQGPATGTARVVRGGSWNSTAARCRSAVRNHYAPGFRFYVLGLRVVREIS